MRRGTLAVLGLGCGFSPAFFGYFDISVWGVIAVALLAVAIGLLVAKPAIPTGAAGIAVLALALYAGWCLVSALWAESADRAITEGDRWILSAVFLLILVLLIADRRDGEVFVFSAALGVVCVGVYDLVQMLSGDGPNLFGGSRLLEPLGYVNGLGGYFLLGFWPLIAVAERARPVLAGASAGGATLLASLVLLTNSRGTAFAFGVSALGLLLFFPGRLRRGWVLVAVVAAVAIAWAPLTDITEPLRPGQSVPDEGTISRGAEWAVLMALGVGIVWALACWAVDLLRDRSPGLEANLPRAAAALLAGIAVVSVAVALGAVGNPFRSVSDEYEAFTELTPIETTARGTSTRFTSGGGNRYDYWRIAWGQFADRPLEGVGAGNFDRTYFVERRTDEDVRQAHSIELQALGETGVVGALVLATFLAAVFVGIGRRARAAGERGSVSAVTIAATGMFVVWLAQTSVDWLHLIPGLTGMALGAAGVLLLPPRSARPQGSVLRGLPPLGTIAALALAVAAIVAIGRPTLAEHLRSQARDELGTRPAEALATANDSLSLNPEAVQGHYLKAAALARLGAYRPARDALSEAIEIEPHNHVTWALLGDLMTRRGEISEAMEAYARASELNPRDRALAMLGSRRSLVRRLHRDPSSGAALFESLASE